MTEVFPEDVLAATRVISRWLARKSSGKVGRPLRLMVSRTGELDLGCDSLKEAYERGLDDGLKATTAEIHTDPDKFTAGHFTPMA